MFKAIWQLLLSVKLTIYLLFLVSLNLAIGAFYIKEYPTIFRPLNQMLFPDWFKEHSMGESWWILFLIFLLVLLGVNTFACTVDRLAALWSKRREYSFNVFFLKISPSLMHIFFLVALSGHALSIFTGTHKQFPLKTGEKIVISDLNLEVKEIRPMFWKNPLLQYPLRQCTVVLDLETPSGIHPKKLSFLHPFWFAGWSFHLDANPKSEPLMFMVLMKKDPGTRLILVGGAGLSLLMLWYFLNINKNKKEG